MESWRRILMDLIVIGILIYLDINVFGPMVDEVVESGVTTLNSLDNPIYAISFRSMFIIIGIFGWIDLILQIYHMFKD